MSSFSEVVVDQDTTAGNRIRPRSRKSIPSDQSSRSQGVVTPRPASLSSSSISKPPRLPMSMPMSKSDLNIPESMQVEFSSVEPPGTGSAMIFASEHLQPILAAGYIAQSRRMRKGEVSKPRLVNIRKSEVREVIVSGSE